MNETSSVQYYTDNPVVIAIYLIVAVILLVALWKIFEKANEPGWKCLIPFYGLYTEFKFLWGNGWFFLLLFVPIVNIVVTIMMMWKMSKAFGQSALFFIGLLLFQPIFLCILAFGSASYIGSNGKPV